MPQYTEQYGFEPLEFSEEWKEAVAGLRQQIAAKNRARRRIDAYIPVGSRIAKRKKSRVASRKSGATSDRYFDRADRETAGGFEGSENPDNG